ncbi:MAG: cyanobactin biosynthesis system PatB/AcyB/McaB family protein [Pseudanabaenales cyanobacterium]|nr:cyanobactin biosynthesis system PatB/AcyB/McaB family protein [Pseudanabaenales cyanobacterium]
MKLPYLSPPVKRPDVIQPSSAVDVENGRFADLVGIKKDLLHGANYNDPAAFEYRNYRQVMTSQQRWGGYAGMRGGRFH